MPGFSGGKRRRALEPETKKRIVRVALVFLALGAAAGLLFWLRPPCLILETTGYYCGACGFTRMVEELLEGHVWRAFRQNPYLFVMLPLTAVYLGGEGVCYIRGRRPLWRRKWMVLVFGLVLAAGLVFTLLRNLPGFEALGPF